MGRVRVRAGALGDHHAQPRVESEPALAALDQHQVRGGGDLVRVGVRVRVRVWGRVRV